MAPSFQLPFVNDPARRRAEFLRRFIGAWLCLGFVIPPSIASDILRGGAPGGSSASRATGSAGAANAGTAAVALPTAVDRLARTSQALAAVKQMQDAARNLALSGANNLKPGLPSVPLNSYGRTGGLVLAPGVPKDLLKPASAENPLLWTGAKLPTVATQTNNGVETTEVTIEQTQQQAVLNWETFNVGKTTTLTFDQGAGGVDAGQWIAFNLIRDPTGSPTQILGSIRTIGAPDASGKAQPGGQVYVMNSNGIIFGGTSQVNAHGLVASSLPINYNLIQRGLINNPDAQFLFSALPQAAGSRGPTPAFDPATASPDGLVPVQTPYAADSSGGPGNYGEVVVQPGARLSAPTTADHVGGRIALVGPNVTNAGTLSTPDGQTILAAGLQVGFSSHNSTDPTLRGLDVFVGAVADASLPNQPVAGTATNAGLDAAGLGIDVAIFNPNAANGGGLNVLGLIEAPRGSVYLTGRTINQSGVIDSSTSVAYNGRVDLVAGYNAVANPKYDPSADPATDFTLALPFFYPSNVGNELAGEPVTNSGAITLGRDSVIQILPEIASTDRVVGDLALLSQVNVEGASVRFAANSEILAPGAAVPIAKAYGADGGAFDAGVTIRAGQWFNPASTQYRFVQANDNQQVYFDEGATIDVAGLANVSASVTENIVDVELRGSELANSPLQRDGPLRGATIQVDVRQHGPWDPTLNGGLGGYSWVGTPLADTSGWIGLATHSVGELATNGGSVSVKAGGAVVLKSGATIDVSGGSIAYAGGYTHTTKVISGGHVYDIAKASADVAYDGVYTGVNTTYDPKWGISESTFNALAMGSYENGYTQGGAGGSVAITAPVVALDGTLRGHTSAGLLQRTLSPLYNPASPPDPANPKAAGTPGWLVGALNRPLPSQLSISIRRQYLPDLPGADYQNISPTPANIVFKSSSSLAAVGDFQESGSYLFPVQRNYELDLSPDLVSEPNGAGFGVLRVDNSDDNIGAVPGYGSISLARGTMLALPVAGSLSLSAGNISIGDSTASALTGISAPSGWINLSAFDVSPSVAKFLAQLGGSIGPDQAPVFDPARGKVTVGANALLSTAGALVDDRPNHSTDDAAPLVYTGGSVALIGTEVSVQPGATIDVSGGALLGATGKLTSAAAGSLTLAAGSALGSGFGAVLGGVLRITGANLKGYAGVGSKGGSLSIQAPSILVQSIKSGALTATNPTGGALTLAPEFFNAGGFAAFTLTGLGFAAGTDGRMTGAAPALTIAATTTVQPRVQSWQSLPGGAVFTAEEGLRTPVKLTFKSPGQQSNINGIPLLNDASLVLGSGAVIATDPGGSVTFSGGSGATIDLLGRITAKGGQIVAAQSGNGNYRPTVHLGSASVLDAAGSAVWAFDIAGYHKSDVLDGGSVTVSGNIVAEAGAKIDVSGASDTVLLSPGVAAPANTLGSGAFPVATTKDSNGGTILLEGQQLLFTAATLFGGPGLGAGRTTSTGQGGELVVASRRYSFVDPYAPTATDAVLNLTAAAPDFVYAGLGQAVKDSKGIAYGDSRGLGLIWFSADSFNQHGFASLELGAAHGALQVLGNVALVAGREIALADGGVLTFTPTTSGTGTSPSALNLTAPYVVLGQPFLGPLQPAETAAPLGQQVAPIYGAGVLSVQASLLIDVGNLAVRGAGTVLLDATGGGKTSGSIRGDGALDVAGTITLQAGQIYPPTAVAFDLNAFDYSVGGTTKAGSVTILGSKSSAPAHVPLSAGGTLNVSASIIDQGGTLRAPFGTLNLGATEDQVDPLSGNLRPTTTTLTLRPGSVTSVSAIDPITGQPITAPYGVTVNGDSWIDPTGVDITGVGPVAKSVTLTSGSIDLQGAAGGKAGATIDLSGGGDLYAYQFVPGTGGAKDFLAGALANGFAIMPANSDLYAPVAPFDGSTVAGVALGGDAGYVVGNPALNYRVGDRIHLAGGGGLPAGDYTLLPARYATLPGAYLVTPRNGSVTAGSAPSVAQADGSTVMSGYRFNGFDAIGAARDQFTSFEIAPQAVVLQRAEYDAASANTFFPKAAEGRGQASPRIPLDAGQLVLAAGSALSLQGAVTTAAATGGRGGQVDISSAADILIGSRSVLAALRADGGGTGELLLDAAELTQFGADSLLVGGVRSTGPDGTIVTTRANRLTVDNAGETLGGSDIVLVANRDLTLAADADIQQTRTLAAPADSLTVKNSLQLTGAAGDNVLAFNRGGTAVNFPNGLPEGNSLLPTVGGTITTNDGTTSFAANAPITAAALPAGATITLNGAGTLTASFNSASDPIAVALGDGVLVRVTSDPTASIQRAGVASSTAPTLKIGAGAHVSGNAVILDSTHATLLDPSARLSAQALSLDSGQISFQLPDAGPLQPTAGLVLTAGSVGLLQSGTQSLSLLSYSSLDLYGSGTIGAFDASGNPTLAGLALHAGEIRGFSSAGGGGSVTFAAKKISLDNRANAAGPVSSSDPLPPALGQLTFDAGSGTIELGAHSLAVDGYSGVTLRAGGGVQVTGTGGLAVQQDLTIATPVISGATSANQSLSAGGDLRIVALGSAPTIATDGLGAQLALNGASVAIDSGITLHSGALSVRATSGDVLIGEATASRLDVTGTKQSFYDVDKYTDAGRINLAADAGSITLGSSATLDLSALPGGGAAGALAVGVPGGTFTVADSARLLALGGADGQGGADGSLAGSFSLDVGELTHTAALDAALNFDSAGRGGFSRARSVRVRTGDVALDGAAVAHEYDLAADEGTITVTADGRVDAAGRAVDASGRVVDVAAKLADGSWKTDGAGHLLDAAGNGVALAGGTGGKINFAAHGSVVLEEGAALTVAGTYVDASGKGGAVSLAAGSSRDGVAPSATDSRDPLTQVFQKPDTAVVDIQAGSSIDLSVATSSVGLAAGQNYALPRGSAPGDLIAVDAAGVMTHADGTTTTFSAGLLPAFEAGSHLALDAPGHLTYLADGLKGTYTGTLHLRAPQTTPEPPVGSAPASAPDVQINPINGALLNPSSIVVEGYQTYQPIAGYIDSVEVDIDANGRSFASGANTSAILASLTTHWDGTHPNGVLSKAAGAQLHVRPGAEIVGATSTDSINTITYSAPGSTSSVTVPAGLTVVLPSTTDLVKGLSTNTVVFTSAATLKPVNAGSYTNTVTSIGTSTTTITPLNVAADTSITVTTAVVAGRLTSSVGGTIKLANGALSTFAPGTLPALAASSTITFAGPGAISSAGTSTVAVNLAVKNVFAAGSTVKLPANSTVVLGTDGGSATFANAGTLTWTAMPVSAANTFAVQVPTGGTFTTGAGTATISATGGSGGTLNLVKTTAASSAAGGGTLTLAAGGTLVLPAGTFTATNTDATNGNTLQVGPASTSSTAAFVVTVKSAQGATLSFPNAGTSTVTTQRGGTQTLAKKTLDAAGVGFDAGGSLAFGVTGSSGLQIRSSAAGVLSIPSQNFTANGITLPAAGGTLTIPAGVNGVTVAAGVITSTVGGTITAPDGTVTTFAAPSGVAGVTSLPTLVPGSVISIANGKLALGAGSGSFAVTVTNNIPAGTATAIGANGVFRLSGAGTVSTVTGSLGGVTIARTLTAGQTAMVAQGDSIQLVGAADIATVQSDRAFNVSGNGPVSLALAADNPTASKVTFLNGTGRMLAAVPSGSYTTTGATDLVNNPGNDLTLASLWDLSLNRYGPNVDPTKPGAGEPGILTVRAPGNLVFSYTGYNPTTKILAAGSLSDGFGPAPTAANGGTWQATLLTGGAQSWSYQLAAGADLGAADFHAVRPLDEIAGASGSVLLGRGSPVLPAVANGTRLSLIPQFYQTIRTGTGDIDIAAGRDAQLLNPLATIYTAGTGAGALADFDLPVLNSILDTINATQPYYAAQYAIAGGSVTISAQRDIARYVQNGSQLMPDSSQEMPTNWLYRRGNVGSDGAFAVLTGSNVPAEVQSTSWWIDYSNFFSDVGALGGGNLALRAGRDVSNVNAAVPTNARMPGRDSTGKAVAPDASKLLELGGGNLAVSAGGKIDGGVYYVERGDATVSAGGAITTNATRAAFTSGANLHPVTWLPTTFFLGKGDLVVAAGGDVTIGQVANPFLLPQGANNRAYEASYFSTFDEDDKVSLSSLGGSVTLQGQAVQASNASGGTNAWLLDWYASVLSSDSKAAAILRPWLRLAVDAQDSKLTAITPFQTVASLLPPSLSVTAFAGDINVIGTLTLTPAPRGTLDLLAAGSLNGLTVNGENEDDLEWRSAAINLSDADPARVPGIANPLSFAKYTRYIPSDALASVDLLFAESGRTNLSLGEKLALHAQQRDDQGQLVPLHAQDAVPAHLYAGAGDISGVTLYSAKSAKVVASNDVTDIALYVQNVHPDDVSVVAAGRDLIPYDPASPLRLAAQQPGNVLAGLSGATGPAGGTPTAGDIQIAGPGTIEVLAGRDLILGSGSNPTLDGTAAGLTSVGSARNPVLPESHGSDIIAAAGVQSVYTTAAAQQRVAPGLATTALDFADFIAQFLAPDSGSANAQRYLPYLGGLMGLGSQDDAAIWSAFGYQRGRALTEEQAALVLNVFHRVMRDAGRDRNDPDSPVYRSYTNGLKAILALFPGSPLPTEEQLSSSDPSQVVVRPAGPWDGRLSLATREIKTFEGSDISILVPGGGITVGRPTDPQKADQGILTERGGGISIYAADSVNVGTSRIFTLRGGNESIWSTWGNIAAGSGSKTVFSAPPTRVLVDPQSADVKNDLAGLATGSGIGVLATLSGVKPGDVDLIAPVGTIDAGDAGIRASGNVNLAAHLVVNAANIQTGGGITGAPPPPPAPNIAGLTSAANTSAAAGSSATEVANQAGGPSQAAMVPSLITVEVLGYGGGEGDDSASAVFFFTFEGHEIEAGKATLTVAELKSLAGIPANETIVVETPDGGVRTLADDETITLPSGRSTTPQPVYRRR